MGLSLSALSTTISALKYYTFGTSRYDRKIDRKYDRKNAFYFQKTITFNIYSSNSTTRLSSAFFLNLKELKSEYNFAQFNKSVCVVKVLFWWSSHKENNLEFKDA